MSYDRNAQRFPSAPQEPATAPYNFIPWFKDKTLRAVPDTKRGVLYSGSIECTLEALTPLLIGANQDRKEDGNEPSHKSFFKVNGSFVIPGSSLKGMLRSFIEIISNSHMAPVSCEKLFWRNVAGKKNATYKTFFESRKKDEKGRDVILGGYLVKKGVEIDLYPVDVHKTRNSPKAYSVGSMFRKDRRTHQTIRFANCYEFAPFDPDGERIRLPHEIWDMFKSPSQMTDKQKDIWRHEQSKFDRGEPARIFFTEDIQHRPTPEEPRRIMGIGTCRFFRVPYKQTVADAAGMRPKDDFAATLFGHVDSGDTALRGRVRIEAAVFEGMPTQLEQEITAVLGQPHPTCLSHYLEQPRAKVGKNLFENLDNYSSETVRLRGRKYYWHRKPADWNKELQPPQNSRTGNVNMRVVSVLHPLKAGAKACFILHVDRVDEVELGAILEALCMPKGHAHKLGMGKALGFGSVRLEVAAVKVAPVAERYASLKARFADEEPLMNEAAQQACREAFRNKVAETLGQKDARELQEAVNMMTDFVNCPLAEKTRTMPLQQGKENADYGCPLFKNRPLLPSIREIYNGKKAAR